MYDLFTRRSKTVYRWWPHGYRYYGPHLPHTTPVTIRIFSPNGGPRCTSVLKGLPQWKGGGWRCSSLTREHPNFITCWYLFVSFGSGPTTLFGSRNRNLLVVSTFFQQCSGSVPYLLFWCRSGSGSDFDANLDLDPDHNPNFTQVKKQKFFYTFIHSSAST